MRSRDIKEAKSSSILAFIAIILIIPELLACRADHRNPHVDKTDLMHVGTLTDLDTARNILNNLESGHTASTKIASINLDHYDFHWEVDIGHNIRVLALSMWRAGALLAYQANGSLLGTIDTGEIVTLQLYDFDGDNNAEIVTEETVGSGTGVLKREFRIYKIDGKVKRLWAGESYFNFGQPEPVRTESTRQEFGWITFKNNGFLHILMDQLGKTCTVDNYEVENGVVKLVGRSACMSGHVLEQ